jgi:hypothetical protein
MPWLDRSGPEPFSLEIKRPSIATLYGCVAETFNLTVLRLGMWLEM